MKKVIFILGAMLMMAATCNKPQGNGAIKEDFSLELYYTGCRGNCPNYRVTVKADGKATYWGNHAVEKMGTWEKQVNESTLKTLVSTMDEYKFWDFEKEYGGGVADIPGVVTTYTYNGKTNKVNNIRQAPKELEELEEKLKDIIDYEQGWKQVSEE